MKMTYPNIHSNGSHPNSLSNYYIEALRAIDTAIDAAMDTAPHGRDYFKAEEFDTAQNEYFARLRMLREVRGEMDNLLTHVSRHVKY